jgi:MFS family permease
VSIINFFNLMFAAVYLLFAVHVLHLRAGLIGVILGAAAFGGVLGAAVTTRLAGRIGIGRAYVLGCLLFTAPLLLVPLAGGPELAVIGVLFAAEFISGFGVMVLDISIGSIFAAVIPDELRSRVSGRQLRHPARRRAARRTAGHRTRAASRLVDRLGGRCSRLRAAASLAAAVAADAAARRRGGDRG